MRKGDAVHHPQHGIGQVQSIREKSFYGEEASSFAKLYFERDDLTLMLPETELDETVREPISSKDARKLLDELKAWKGKPSKQWKTRARANQAAIDCGDPFEYAKVYKALCTLESENALRAQDRAHLTQSTNLLVDELAHSLRKSPDQARALLNKASG
ncbi:CarD family transcriptional regulator [Marinihelvus fidelis]|uniref:CarD family transcriptional regulator n=1 Tax=Marinihelvus fidelis TaxID=2613842 RepID=UPI001CD80A10|nr:CarD family transcriptional regulator [Marinihelvus fidelis]